MRMVATILVCPWIFRETDRGKNVLPRPFPIRIGKLSLQRPWQVSPPSAAGDVSPMYLAHLNLVACKIDIFDTQPQALEKAHSGAKKKGRHQLVGATHHTQDALDLLFAQDQRPALWLFRSCNIGKLPELFLQHFVVKKDQGVEGLLLRTGGNPFIHGKVG